MGNELQVRGDIPLSQLGEYLAHCGYFQDAREVSQAVVKVLAGREMGMGPISSMTGINIIKGRVSVGANLIASAIKRSGRYNYRVVDMSDGNCEIAFYEGTEEIGRSSFDTDDAQQAGLNGGDNWKKYPRNMLFARAISNGAKWYCPDVFGGPVYTPDELGAEVDGETLEPINVPATPVNPLPVEQHYEPLPENVHPETGELLPPSVPSAATGVVASNPYVITRIASIEIKNGSNANTGKPWKRFDIRTTEPERYATFDAKLADVAELSRQAAVEVVLVYKQSPKGKDLVSIDRRSEMVV